METTIQVLIYSHAFLGAIGLLAGLASIVLKKGSKPHQKMGKLFSISMLGSCLLSLFIACMPKHENPFLFLIGFFTIYLVISGNRALTFKTKPKAGFLDKIISGTMFLAAIIMLLFGIYGMINALSQSFLFVFFGAFGLFMSTKDFIFFNSQHKKNWLAQHIGKMVGAFIASVTAFIVAGLGLGSILSWIVPSIIGTVYIIYWNRKMKPKTLLSSK